MGRLEALGRDAVVGNYDWRFLCVPTPPWKKNWAMTPYFGADDQIPLSVALGMGLQYALAMVGGIIIPSLLISSMEFSREGQLYLVSAPLIVSVFSTFVQIMQFRIPYTKYVLGSGLLSVMGISFSLLPVAQQVMVTLTECTCRGVACTVGGKCASCTSSLDGHCLTAEQA